MHLFSFHKLCPLLKTSISQKILLLIFIFSAQILSLGAQSIQFSEERGFYSAPIQVALTTDLPNATIMYTLDMSIPSQTNGTAYTSSLPINTTTSIRAIAFNSTDTLWHTTSSYIFLSDVIADTNMKLHITQDPLWAPQLNDAFLDIPTAYVVNDSILNSDIKVASSVEFFFPTTGEKVQTNCGTKLFGNGGYHTDRLSIRLYFDEEWEAPKNFEFDMFNGFDEGLKPVKKFDKLDLRHGWYNTWDNKLHDTRYQDYNRHNYISTKIGDDIMLQMGHLSPHTRFMHIYNNGVYNGIVTLRERFDDNMAAEYLGGDNDDYEYMATPNQRVSAFHPYSPDVKHGTGEHWDSIVSKSTQSYAAWKPLVDENNFFDRMIAFCYGQGEAEYRAISSPARGQEYILNLNDADYFFYSGSPVHSNRTNPLHNVNGPDNMFQNLYLSGDEDFRMDFADRVHKHATGNGILTHNQIFPHWQYISNIVDKAMIAESARWSPDSTHNRDSWRVTIDTVGPLYTSVRCDVMLEDFKNVRLYPTLDAVTPSVPEGEVPLGTTVQLTNPNNNGQIYYTIDGVDPRASGGLIDASAQLYSAGISLTNPITKIRARVKGSDTTYNSTNHAIGKPSVLSSRLSATLYGPEYANDGILWSTLAEKTLTRPQNEFQPWWEVDLQSVENVHEIKVWYTSELGSYFNNKNVYIFSSNSPIPDLDAAVLAADPNIESLYLAGQSGDVIEYKLPPNSTARYVRVMMEDQTQTLWLSEVEVLEYDSINPVVHDVWSAMQPLVYRLPQNYTDLVINEIHYDPDDSVYFNPVTAMMDTVAGRNFEFVELKNNGTEPIYILGELFNDGIHFKTEECIIIPPNDFFVLAEDASWFATKYGFSPDAEFVGELDNGGEYLQMVDYQGNIIDSLTYDDKNGWPSEPDQGVVSLGLKLPSTLDNGVEDNWSVQSIRYTPNAENVFDPNHAAHSLQLNEIQYHDIDSINGATVIDDDVFEFIELKNTSAAALDISGYFFSRGVEYRFPMNTIVPANGFIVIAKDSLFFNARNGSFPNGVYEGKLKNSGEDIWLHDDNGDLIDALSYDDSSPWDALADGTGFSLALKKDSIENADANDWRVQCQTTTLWAENKHETDVDLNGTAFEICAIDSIVLNTLEQGLSVGGNWMFNGQAITVARDAGVYHYSFTNASGCTSIDSIDITHQIPDYVATLAIAPSAIVGPTQVRNIVSISEVQNKLSCSSVYVLIPKDINRFNFTYLPNALSIGGVSVNNSDWQYYSTNPGFHVWEYIAGDFPALGTKKIGFIGLYDPNNTDGATTFTAQLFGGSGGEVNGLNNSDSESLIYFK